MQENAADSELVKFLRARLIAESDDVRALMAEPVVGDDEMWTEFSDAETRIVELHSGPHHCPGSAEHAQPAAGPYVGCDTIRLLAFDRRDDPEFRDEWLPDDVPTVVRTEAPRGGR